MLWPLTMTLCIAVGLLIAGLVLARFISYLIGRGRNAPRHFLSSVESAYHEGRAESEHDG